MNTKTKIERCPEGHDCTSNCRRNGCPCFEHMHSMNEEERKDYLKEAGINYALNK